MIFIVGFLVNNGVGGKLMLPVVSILIILGSVSTAVNLIAAGTARVCKKLAENFNRDAKPTKQVIIFLAFDLWGQVIFIYGFSLLSSRSVRIIKHPLCGGAIC